MSSRRDGKPGNRKHVVPAKEAVVALVERDGKVRSQHVPDVTGKTLRPMLQAQVDGATYLMTDESPVYLKRYLAEFDFRYNERSKLGVSDAERFYKAIPGIVGKRLTYRRINQHAEG